MYKPNIFFVKCALNKLIIIYLNFSILNELVKYTYYFNNNYSSLQQLFNVNITKRR